jgi:hypothetical protein
VAKVESYRDKIQAAIELLAVEEEPADLETLLRYLSILKLTFYSSFIS